jgi:hypothetical protein
MPYIKEVSHTVLKRFDRMFCVNLEDLPADTRTLPAAESEHHHMTFTPSYLSLSPIPLTHRGAYVG